MSPISAEVAVQAEATKIPTKDTAVQVVPTAIEAAVQTTAVPATTFRNASV